MAMLIGAVVDGYSKLWDIRDPRVEGWLFMSSPLPTLLICLSYVYIVKVLGPKLMADRKPFELRNVLIVYNFLQVIFSCWLFYEYGRGGWFHGYSFVCQPVDYSLDDMAVRMVYACWWYYFSKFTEFFDTFFFVLRKKDQHISLLHVVHHGIMPMSVWFGVRFTPGGHSTFFGLLNTFVHIVMYFYYMVAAMGPQYQKYIWWKKHLTTFQMVQFVLIVLHAFQLLFIECNYPKAFVWWIGCHGVLFFALFSDFYRKSYFAKRKQQREAKAALTNGKANGYTNGVTNGVTNGTTNGYTNGHANGHTNGYTNGYTNGHTNGHANGYSNGKTHENGYSNGKTHENGYSNGHTNGHANGSIHSKDD